MKTAVRAVKIVLFTAIVIGGILAFQEVLDRDWCYPSFAEAPGDMLEEYYQLADEVDFQAVFIGASGFEWDIQPMMMYEDTGIVSYDLVSSGQPFPVSYYLCQEMLKTQRPKVVVVDASCLFLSNFFDGGYHYILDSMPLSRTKLQFAEYYAEQFANNGAAEKKLDAFIGALFPLYQYHTRWNVITDGDFDLPDEKNLYRKGGLPSDELWTTGMTIDWMEDLAGRLSTESGWRVNVSEGEDQRVELPGAAYAPSINEEHWEMALRMKQMCEENGARLLLLKTPHFGHPMESNQASWTRKKSDILKERATQAGVEFIDLQYDVDLGLDWSTDAGAGSQHLNMLGAEKVMAYIEGLLQSEYGIEGRYCAAYEEDLPLYSRIRQLQRLHLTTDYFQYLDRLSEFDDITLFFSAADDMQMGLTDEICQALNGLGLQTDFHDLSYSDAYIAVIENGTVSHESYSNRIITDGGTLGNGVKYSLTSAGFVIGSQSSIKIDGKEYSRNGRGLNIVVLDNASGIVLDRVTFDMHSGQNATNAVRTGGHRNEALYMYENYLQIQDKNGLL